VSAFERFTVNIIRAGDAPRPINLKLARNSEALFSWRPAGACPELAEGQAGRHSRESGNPGLRYAPLQQLADELEMEIPVCHFPLGHGQMEQSCTPDIQPHQRPFVSHSRGTLPRESPLLYAM
jgi:hypothetical protein